MPLSSDENDHLDDLQFMLGEDAGRLALALEQLTDIMAMLGQHLVHCRVERGPRAGEPPLDLVHLLETIQNAKLLVQETMLGLKNRGS